MAASTNLQDTPPTSRWRRICHGLWRGLGFFYGTLLLGLLINLISNTLSFGRILLWVEQHLMVAGLVVSALLFLTALAWFGTRQSSSLTQAHTSLSSDQRDRVGILATLRKAYTDELAASLQGVARIVLGLHERFDLTHPARLSAWHPGEPERALPDGSTILDAYRQAGHGLLVLGEPGAGKTTLLYDLALALLKQAEPDETHLLPVVLNLSSWATKRQQLQLWLVEELELRYLIPRRLGSRWVQEGRFQLLLDGLDEVATSARDACIEAINTYHAAHLLPLVVCSRREEYEAASKRVTVQSAVIVQPLTSAQVITYLKEAGKGLSAVRKVVQTNVVLRELITTPLMLSVVTLAYQGKTVKDLSLIGTVAEQQQRIFASYLQRMLHLSAKPRTIFPKDLQRTLIWLARQLQQRSLSVFYLERLQPDWLTAPWAVLLYEWLGIRLPGIVVGALTASLAGTLLASISYEVLFTPTNYSSTITGIALLCGLVGGCVGGLLSKPDSFSRGASQYHRSHKFFRRGIRAILFGLFIGVGTWLISGEDVIAGACFGIGSLLFALLLSRKSVSSHKNVVLPGKATMTSRSLWRAIFTGDALRVGVLAGGLFGLSAGLAWSLGFGLNAGLAWGPEAGLNFGLNEALGDWLNYGLPIGLSAMLISQLLVSRSPLIEAVEILVWSWKNLWQSLIQEMHWRNVLLIICGSTMLIGLNYGLSTVLGAVLSTGLSAGLSYGLSAGPSAVLAWGVGVGLTYGLIIAGWYWLLVGLFQGVASDHFQERQRVRPNIGICRSLQNGLLLGAAGGIFSTIIVGLILPLSSGLSDGLNEGLRDGLNAGLSYGLDVWQTVWQNEALSFGLAAGGAGALLFTILLGGLAWWRHWVLRFLLWRSCAVPLRIVSLLDEATQRVLLRKSGGGYRFIHDLFRDYLAISNPTSSSGTVSHLVP